MRIEHGTPGLQIEYITTAPQSHSSENRARPRLYCAVFGAKMKEEILYDLFFFFRLTFQKFHYARLCTIPCV